MKAEAVRRRLRRRPGGPPFPRRERHTAGHKDAGAEGTIRASDASIEGTVNGRIDCAEGAVEFASSARCTAHVMYQELSGARGAEVEAELQKVGCRRG